MVQHAHLFLLRTFNTLAPCDFMSLRIIAADDHPVVFMGIRMALSHSPYPTAIVGEAVSTHELVQRLECQPCDMLITDFSMPNGNFPDGMVLIRYIRRNFASIKIIVMTMLSNPHLLSDLLKNGVQGLFDKHQPLEGLIHAIHRISRGQTYISETFSSVQARPRRGETLNSPLTERELEVLRLIGQNQSGREIAEHLNRSEKTISRQKRMAMQKLGIQCNSDLMEFVRKSGLV